MTTTSRDKNTKIPKERKLILAMGITYSYQKILREFHNSKYPNKQIVRLDCCRFMIYEFNESVRIEPKHTQQPGPKKMSHFQK